jgi:hypothetical protein
LVNAYIDFTKMTTSLVAVITNVVRDEKKVVVGYGFNPNGRYGQGGLIRERFAPRILEAEAATLLDQTGEKLDRARFGRHDDQREARWTRRALGCGGDH